MHVGIRKAALRLGLLAAAATMMNREDLATTADACVVCQPNQSCISGHPGTAACSFEGGKCHPAGQMCS
jgi:hypothetical protein